MESQDLKYYEEKILSLTPEERKQRELYLKKLANGEIQGPETNYSFFDQQWLKNYTDDAIMSEYPRKTMYDFLYESNKEHLNEYALRYFGKKFTFGELFENIDIYAQSLLSSGIKEGDTIAICAPTTPEAVYLFYAINKIGAVANLIDLRKDLKEIEYCLNLCDTKALFVYDGALEKLNKIVGNTKIESVITVSATNSLPKPIQFVSNPKQYISNIRKRKNKNRNFLELNEFLQKRDKNIEIPKADYEKDKPAFIVYTSGTTGLPKAVVLTSDVANQKVNQYMTNGMIYNRQDTYLNVMPLFLAFGTIVGMHLPLTMGMMDDLIPSYDMNKTLEIINKSKPQHLAVTPAAYIELINSKGFNKSDFSNVYTWGCGGDGMNAAEEEIINEKLAEQGSTQKVSNGYGASEIGAPFATQKVGVTKPGTVGNPLPGNNVIILDHETGEMLPNNVIGDVCMIVDSPMVEYKGNKELTDETKIDLGNGNYGIMLKDAGYVDSEGNLVIKGRYKDTIQDPNGNYIWPVDVENYIMSTRMVQNCAAVSIENQTNALNMFVVLNPGVDKEIFESTLNSILHDNNFNSFEYNIVYLEEMLMNSNGKIDRKKLRETYSNDTLNRSL